jgi:hypothetical protein
VQDSFSPLPHPCLQLLVVPKYPKLSSVFTVDPQSIPCSLCPTGLTIKLNSKLPQRVGTSNVGTNTVLNFFLTHFCIFIPCVLFIIENNTCDSKVKKRKHRPEYEYENIYFWVYWASTPIGQATPKLTKAFFSELLLPLPHIDHPVVKA